MSKRADLGGWVSLMDYANQNGVSLSTLRRYIKANKIEYKIENGRYLVFSGTEEMTPVSPKNTDTTLPFFKLQSDLMKAQKEIAELKTLIAFYEEQLPKNSLNQ